MKILKRIPPSIIEKIKRLLLVLLGSLISAVGVSLFIKPFKLLSGGITGIALIINIIRPIDIGIAVLVLNIPLFILAWKKLNTDFAIYSLVGTISLSLCISLVAYLNIYTGITDTLLASIIGGVLNGIGTGTVFRQRASCGGTDIVSVLLRDKVAISIPTLGFIINIFVVALGIVLSNFQIGAYTLVSMYVSSQVCNQILSGMQKKKMLIVATDKFEGIAEAINTELGRGATLLYGEGSFTHEFKCLVYCIVSASQLTRTLALIKQADSNAFVTISEVSEVRGNGFKKPLF